jgi:DNA-binding LacI/PurR family transcriptional regulator
MTCFCHTNFYPLVSVGMKEAGMKRWREPRNAQRPVLQGIRGACPHGFEDIAVVGFDDIALARTTNPPLTTISQPIRKLAATAFKTLLARIRYPNNDPREIFLDAPLVTRQST